MGHVLKTLWIVVGIPLLFAGGCPQGTIEIGCEQAEDCDDQNLCTNEECFEKICLYSDISGDCNDDNPCTTETCSPSEGCLVEFVSGPCDDQDICTTNDRCQNGSCQPGEPLVCDDQNLCTTDSCEASKGCVFLDHASGCDDQNTCTQDSCDPSQGCLFTPIEGSCSDGDMCTENDRCEQGKCQPGAPVVCDLVMVVEESLLEPLRDSFAQYMEDNKNQHKSHLVPWSAGGHEQLRTLLQSQRQEFAIKGALLVGELPAAWYERMAFEYEEGEWEEFPCDFVLMDLDAQWVDDDKNGIYDRHSPLTLDIYLSRIMGTSEELVSYFSKLHTYKTTGSLVAEKAFVFKDDDWFEFLKGDYFGLDALYGQISKIEEPSATTKSAYINQLENLGSEYVLQMIHSYPWKLIITGNGGGEVVTQDVIEGNFKASFYNMFNCSACRFTEENLGMTYVMKTDAGLAALGSTKVGGLFDSTAVNMNLAASKSWGQAFIDFYNQDSDKSDDWLLGMVILGDPLLQISKTTRSMLAALPTLALSDEERLRLWMKMREIAKEQNPSLGSFKEYCSTYPHFFLGKHKQ